MHFGGKLECPPPPAIIYHAKRTRGLREREEGREEREGKDVTKVDRV
jgi:hypothetical protein